MKKVLAFVILLAMSLRVFALTVNVNGTDYDVNYYPVPFKNYQTLFENQVWWGNQSLARDFADAVKYQLGIVNPAGNDGPYFAFSYNSNTDIVGGCYYNSANGAQCTTNLTSGGAHGYAVAQPIANKLAYAVDNQNNIYSVDFANGATCLIGNAGSIAIISTMESLALSPSGVLYAVTTSGDLYSIDKDTAASTLIGNTGHNMAGLDFSGATLLGTQWVPGQTPAAVYEINTSTGGATLVQTSSAISGGALFQSAALAVENANTVQLLAYQDISNRNQGVLAAMDLSSGAATIAGATVNDVYAMDYLGDGHLYALGRDGAMYRVNPATGAMTSIGDTGNQVWTGMTAAELIPVTARVNGGNGTVSCSPAGVALGSSSACTTLPAIGYQVQNWTGSCAAAGSNAYCLLNNIQTLQCSTVSFVATPPATYSVSAVVSAGSGSVSCTPANVSAGGSSSCTAVPGPGDQVAGWSGACASAGTNTQCSLTNIQANQSSTVSFSALPPASYHVSATVTGGNGSVSCNPTTVSKGGNSTCTAVPDAGYQVQAWTDACAAWGSQAQCYLSKIRADQSATVSFAPIPPANYNVSATVNGGNGHVSCSPTTVTAGGASTCTAVPDAGYQVQSWGNACASAGSLAQCALTNIQSDQSATVSFATLPVPTYNLSATVAGGNGAVSCTPSSVPQGDSGSCTAVPNPGYQVGSWTGACQAAGTSADCALSNIQADQVSTVSFTPIPVNTYHVNASVTLGHGAVSCTPNTVTSGGNSACTAVPDAGYQVARWGDDCAGWGAQTQCYLTKIKADKTATVSFAPLPPASYTVSATVSAGNGHVSCTPSTVTAGGGSSCTAVPDAGWQIQGWSSACAAAGVNPQCDLTNIQANQSATVSFAALPVPNFTVSATVDGGNGTVSCAPSPVPQGDSSSCTAVPDAGYQVAAWTGACVATGHVVDCALSNIQADQTSTVRFEPIPPASYTVSASVTSGHGAVNCNPGTVSAGGASTCTAVPDPGYRVQAWGGSCTSAGSQTQCSLSAIYANQFATVSFLHALPGTYQVSATVSGGNGMVSCTPTTVAKGEASTCTATPDAGYQVQAWGGDCVQAGASTQCYLPKIQKNQTATVSFAAKAPDTFNVTAVVDGGNGSVNCTPGTVTTGGASTCTAAPEAGYQVAHWDGACLLAGGNPQCTLTNVQSDLSSTVRFSAIASIAYNVSATVTSGLGTVSCTPARVAPGGGSTCTALPSPGFQVASWGGACATAVSNAQCSLTNIQQNQISTVSFTAAVTPPPVNPPVTPATARLINLSSRGWAGSGDALLIDGFILGGGDTPRQIIVRALGPALADVGLADPLANPRLRVTTVDGQPVADNDDWQQAPNAAELERLGYAPPYPQEAALLLTLNPHVPYTVLVDGADAATGLALVEILDPERTVAVNPRLVNLSARGWVGTGDDILIGGLILGGGDAPRRILARVLGPTLVNAQLANVLENPQLTFTTLDGQVLAENDDWAQQPDAAAIAATGLAPPDPREPALLLTLEPHVPHTLLVRGVNGATGLALLEILEVP